MGLLDREYMKNPHNTSFRRGGIRAVVYKLLVLIQSLMAIFALVLGLQGFYCFLFVGAVDMFEGIKFLGLIPIESIPAPLGTAVARITVESLVYPFGNGSLMLPIIMILGAGILWYLKRRIAFWVAFI